MHPVEDEEGMVHVGKIIFDPTDILGRGCEGTTVFKYVFSLLPQECFVNTMFIPFTNIKLNNYTFNKNHDIINNHINNNLFFTGVNLMSVMLL